MPLRVLLYTVLFWEREGKEWEALDTPRPPFQLTPVVPLVFHTGGRPWNTHRTVKDLLAEPESLRALAPQCQPLFWDLAEQDPEALLASAAEWLQTLAVLRAAGAEREEFLRVMRQVVEQLNGLAERDALRWQGLLRFILAWALHRRPLDEQQAWISLARDAQMDAGRQTEVQNMGQTISRSTADQGTQRRT
jgi:hypothetical protein